VQCYQSLREGRVHALQALDIVDDFLGLEIETILVPNEVAKALELCELYVKVRRQQGRSAPRQF